ncbi:MAG TPA: RNA polymerase sigma factor [Lachnospiraceae bacterium]|nr:RNA polymerase sigma factor [Lachnospiraceae bacterium]
MTQSKFEKIYQVYFHYVYLYLLKLCNNEHLAEELTSETFFKAMKGIDKFQGDCDIKTWLVTIAKNTYYSHLKRKKSVVELDQTFEVRDDKVDIENQMIKMETSLEIYKTLHLLEDPYKEVFSLRVLGDLSFKQIAEIYGKTENWACVTYHRAKNKIKSKMEEY